MEEKLRNRYYCLECQEIDFGKLQEPEYRNQSLGGFIDENIPDLKQKYADTSGTLKDKVTFASFQTAKCHSPP